MLTTPSVQPIRVLGLSNGDHRRSMSGVPAQVFDSLEELSTEVNRIDYSVLGPMRLALAAATLRTDRDRWRGHFQAGRMAHRAQSATLRQRLRSLPSFDVALQVHGWLSGQPRPFTVYADQTRLMADRGYPGWIPLPQGDRSWLLGAESAMYASAAHVFAMGTPTRESLIADYGVDPGQVTVVGGGLNLPELPAPRPLPRERSIVFIGREFERKGGEVLLRAFRRVRTAEPRAVLHVAGPRRRIAQSGVVVHGPVDRPHILSLYRQARVFCMPSLYEPYGLVFAEAMAHGVPCVGSTAQSIPEILGNGAAGLLPAAGNEIELADALLTLLRDDALADSLGAAGRRRVEQVHTWAHVAERMMPALLNAAHSARRPG